MKLVWTTVDPNLLQSASHPLFRLQVFSGCTSLCALTEEDSRAEISVILWASITGWWRWRWWWRCVCVCKRGTKALTESEEGRETPVAGAVRTAASLWPPFWLFDVFVLLVIRPPPPGTKEAWHAAQPSPAWGLLDWGVSRLLTSPPPPPRSPHLPWSFCSPQCSWALPRLSFPDIFSPILSCKTSRLQARSSPRCHRCLQPHWNASWVSGEETTSLINQEAPHSLFTAQPIQSLQAHGHRELSSMPALIIRPHQRLFALSNQCLYKSALLPQETTNEYFMSPLIQS